MVAQETHNTLVAGVDELKDKRKKAAEERAARRERGRLTPTVERVVKPTAATRIVPHVEMSTALVPCNARVPLTTETLEIPGSEPLRTTTSLAGGATSAHPHRGGLPVRQYDDIDEDSGDDESDVPDNDSGGIVDLDAEDDSQRVTPLETSAAHPAGRGGENNILDDIDDDGWEAIVVGKDDRAVTDEAFRMVYDN